MDLSAVAVLHVMQSMHLLMCSKRFLVCFLQGVRLDEAAANIATASALSELSLNGDSQANKAAAKKAKKMRHKANKQRQSLMRSSR